MYLVDSQLRDMLGDLELSTPEGFGAFNPEVQVQSCSIDLRLSNVFWRQRPGRSRIDLGSTGLESAPHTHWEKITLPQSEYFDLHPGEFVLSQTLEWFKIPAQYAGKLGGRGSFARLGLLVHLQSELINPGWKGHKGLQLYNASQATLRLYPGLPVCQIMIMRLAGVPDKLYGEAELQSKYIASSGSPSYWWRDSRIREIERLLAGSNMPIGKQHALVARVGPLEVDVLDRFRAFLGKMRLGELESTNGLIEKFLASERRKNVMQAVVRGLPGLLSIPTLFFFLARVNGGDCAPSPTLWCTLPAGALALLLVLAGLFWKVIPKRNYLNRSHANFVSEESAS